MEVKNADTGAVVTGGASETGNFVVRVPAGTYELSVSVTGFKQFVQTGIPVVEGQQTRRDVNLEVGQATEIINVTDQAPLLKTEGGDVSYRVTTQQANQLPVLTLGAGGGLGAIRNPLQMTTLLPGVQFNQTGEPGVFFQTLTINGLPANSQTWTIEGQDATPTLWRGVTSNRGQGGVDAIEAVNVQTSNFAAEYGKAGGAAINYTMKSGTNDFHGSAYDYFVNEFLHAGNPDSDWANSGPAYQYKAGQHVRNRQRRNDYGFTFGGPVLIPKVYDGHDKTFFFFNFEQFRETQNLATGFATVPTDAYRRGDFSTAGCNVFNVATQTCTSRQAITLGGQPAVDVLGNPIVPGTIYDPGTYQVVNGLPVRTPYAGNQLPANAMDPVAVAIQNLFPRPTDNNLINNYVIPPYKNFRTMTIPSIKVDHNLSSTLRIAGYWGQTLTEQNNANGFLAEEFPWTAAQSNPFRNHTIRINIDQTITPTLLLHIGLGYFHQKEPNIAPVFDQTKIGLPGPGAVNAFPYTNAFPTISGLNNFSSGGFSPGIGASFDATAWEEKPTANLNLTWVKGNHTYKFGGDMTIQGYPTHNRWRANGNFFFSANQSGNPWTDGQLLNVANPTGFNYASFLLGQPNSLDLAQPTYTRLGGHAFAFFAQDNWKVTPKLTIEYGLRYDYQTYLTEQYGRHASASFSIFNPTVNRLGGLAYEGGGPCECKLSSNYPYAFGPRFSVSYQVFEKTVFRAGFGINYNVVQTPAGNNFSVGDFYTINPPGFGITPLTNGMRGGNVFYPGNPYGNTEVVWPVFDPGRLPIRNGELLPPVSPFSMYHPDSRPGRIMQWSVGVQHEIIRDLVVEASYVGNRGTWFYSPLLDVQASNTLAGGWLANYGLDIKNQADFDILNVLISSPQAAARGFGLPYARFPGFQQVGQALRPIPQWNTVNPYLGPNRGNTWYDSLQVQATKRYSHGLDLNANFTWAHATALGVNSDTDFFLAGRPTVTDPFNREVNKQLNQLVPPLKTVISGTYTMPGFRSTDSAMAKIASFLLKDWQIGAVVTYQSGQLLTVPNSNNGLSSRLRINLPANGFFSGVPNYNPWNYIEGAPYFRPGFDVNASEVDFRAWNPAVPVSASVLAGGLNAQGVCPVEACAWVDAPPREWGTTAPFLEGFRWRRRPSENFNIGRNFRMGPEGRYVLQVRAEFSNIFNRRFYNAPSTANPTQITGTQTQNGVTFPTSGYGVVNTFNGAGSQPRTGTIVARFTF